MNTLMKSLCVLSLSMFAMVVLAQTRTFLAEGEMEIIAVNDEIESVFIANPAIADYQVVDKQKIALFGKKIGTTGFAVFGAEGKTLVTRQVQVSASLAELKQKVQLLYPNTRINITHIGDSVVLTGSVPNERIKDSINQMVGEFLDHEREEIEFEWDGEDIDFDQEVEFMKRMSYAKVINNIEVATQKQVNVKLSIAEVSHSFLEEFGVQYGSEGAGTGIFVDQLTSFSASDIISVITAIGNDTVGQILAQPNLSVLSGESASFLVGGELPVVTVSDGGTNVEYKEFGVRLELMAKVLDDDNIKLSLIPEVSSLDTQYSNESYDLPALKTRRARTTVQLADGKSFILGGLLSTEDKESLGQIPFVGEVPILGALFRSTGTERTRTELIIVATVNLVQPIESQLVQLPNMQKTTSLERFFNVEPESTPKAGDRWAKEIYSVGGFKL
ncbi:general secretion pathway protein GspD [Vibrio owensii]|uniref:type II and III secretion system protein family protein n=1 Tax=Vibrio owensii TaxID=696485 RepID=UPI0010506403|nr:pilus assembly protein N-terminal domain-containing protein [Vibrio owensii]TDE26255.1 general secretion pathway protein GspD [Vibrio owensii]